MKFPYAPLTQQALDQIDANAQHAYLLHGRAGSGKRVAAFELAAKLIGESNIAKVADFAHPNLFVVERPHDKKNIGIAQIKDLTDKIWRTTNTDGPKVIIICEVSLLSRDAANALLKNLEDAPPNTIYLLTTQTISQVLPTVRSRAQPIYFAPIDHEQGSEYLMTKYKISPQQADDLLELAHHVIGRAEVILRDGGDEECAKLQAQAKKFLEQSISVRFGIAKDIYTQGNSGAFLDELMYTIKQTSTILVHDLKSLEAVMRAEQQLRANVNPRLVFEALGLCLPSN